MTEQRFRRTDVFGRCRPAPSSVAPHTLNRGPGPGTQPQPRRSAGFTLLEMLIAMALMAVVGLLAWRGLTAVGNGTAHIEQTLDRTKALTRAMAQLKLDAAAIATPSEIGFEPLSVSPERLTLVRHLDHPDSEATGTAFQVVSYQLAAHALWRSASPPLFDSAALRRARHTLEHEDPSIPSHASATSSTSAYLTSTTHFALVDRVQRIAWQVWLPQIGWTDDNSALQRVDEITMHPGSLLDHRTDVLPAALSLQLFTTDAPMPLTREVLLGP